MKGDLGQFMIIGGRPHTLSLGFNLVVSSGPPFITFHVRIMAGKLHTESLVLEHHGAFGFLLLYPCVCSDHVKSDAPFR